ncbi:hypothetical protein FA15DRAFT_668812 [Coprinopsis marcescibilis]|uniref:Uncharacterized protein n=1 Tax=Coprinopsis marcescibilis TaxID=230819 RepID=A0A5C3KWS1_COPMA|nr:hypothetical protein FA15DRAFT_668812 [Coprinopsis marcescibilis]
MSNPRIIYFDNDHPALDYRGEWELQENLFIEDRNPVFGGRQMRTTGTASLTFDFTGTEFRMLGRFAPVNTTESIRPTWRCFMNDEEFDGDRTPPRPENGYTFCYRGGDDLSRTGTNRFRMEIEADESAPLWIDAVYVRPNPTSSFESPIWARLTPKDPSVRLGPNWESIDGGDVRYTADEGSFVEIDFIGTRVAWWGSNLVDQPQGTSEGSYSINGETARPFAFTGRRTDFDPGFQEYFRTEELPAGQVHNLRVTYDGFEAPLVFNHVFLENGEILERDPRTLPTSTPQPSGANTSLLPGSPSPSPPGAESSPPSSNAQAGGAQSAPIGAIVGGVVGGIAVVLLLIVLLIFLKKRRRRATSVLLDPPAPMSYVAQQFPSQGTFGAVSSHMSNPSPGGVQAYPASQRHLTGDTNSGSSYPYSYSPNGVPPGVHVKSRAAGGHIPALSQTLTSPGDMYSTSSQPSSGNTQNVSSKAQLSASASASQPQTQPNYHQDSGIRLRDDQTVISDVPPSYTPA